MIRIDPSEAIESALASVRTSGLRVHGRWIRELRDAADRDLLRVYCRQLPIRVRASVRNWPDPFPWAHRDVTEQSEPIYDVASIAMLSSMSLRDGQKAKP